MEKTPRYTSNEKRLLLRLISNQKEIIEKKKTDALTNRSKDYAWKLITKQYNSCVKFKRTAKQLRQLYKNMKYAANVNSTSTSNITEMLEILNMQILNDPNIKSGENVLVSHMPSENVTREEYVMNIIKTEITDVEDDDDDDEIITDNDIDYAQYALPMSTNLIQIDDNTSTKSNTSRIMPNNNNIINNKPKLNNNISNRKVDINNKEILMEIAIEERKKKIELLDTQINYWKILTDKIQANQKICCCKLDTFHNHN